MVIFTVVAIYIYLQTRLQRLAVHIAVHTLYVVAFVQLNKPLNDSLYNVEPPLGCPLLPLVFIPHEEESQGVGFVESEHVVLVRRSPASQMHDMDLLSSRPRRPVFVRTGKIGGSTWDNCLYR